MHRFGLETGRSAASRKEGYEMAADLIEAIVDQQGFKATVEPVGNDRFYLGANNERALIALAFRRARERGGFTVRQASEKLGSNSPNAFGAYEQGRVTPKLDTFTKYLENLGSDMDLVLVPRKRKKRKAA